MEERHNLIKHYFHLGFSNKEILNCLAQNHHCIISIRTLKRLTKKYALYRRKEQTDIVEVALFIIQELQSHSQMYGFRWMHARCMQEKLVVSLENVRLLLSILDPQGVNLRSHRRLQRRRYESAGPNAVWHIDGYDKLKPYGIAIHGCIDGFSRNIIWLNAAVSNNDPRVIAGYFIKAVSELEACPSRVRADHGTENSYIEQMQTFLRRNHDDKYKGSASFISGKSTTNQRIEWFWGLLRKEGIQFWMNIFSSLKAEGQFDGGFLDKNLIRFCFLELVQVSF